MITLALSKGRILDETLPLLAAAGHRPRREPRDQPAPDRRHVDRPTCASSWSAPATCRPTSSTVAPTSASSASTRCIEHGGEGLYRPLDLGVARCRMSVAAPLDFDYAAAAQPGLAHPRRDQVHPHRARPLRRQGRPRRHHQALRLDGAGAAHRPRRRDRRPGRVGQHAEGERAGRGRGDHADLGAAGRQQGGAEARPRARSAP